MSYRKVIVVVESAKNVAQMFALFWGDLEEDLRKNKNFKIKIANNIQEAESLIHENTVAAIAVSVCLMSDNDKEKTEYSIDWLVEIRGKINIPIIVMLCINSCGCESDMKKKIREIGFDMCTKEDLFPFVFKKLAPA